MRRFLVPALLALWPWGAMADAHFLEVHAVAQKPDATTKWYSRTARNAAPEAVFLEREVLLDESAVASAWVEHDQQGGPIIRLKFTNEGARRFGEITEKLVNRRIGFVVAGQLVSAPVIRVPILGGDAIISGTWDETEAFQVAAKLISKPVQ